LLAVLILVGLAATIPFSSDTLRQQVIATLSERLESDAELGGLQLRLLPRVHIQGYGLRIFHKGRRDAPPLIKVDALTIEASLANLLRRHVNTVSVTGLEINITHETDDGRGGEGSGDRRADDH
jgi:uncharacterized protein involved in outer membrane biogenesis